MTWNVVEYVAIFCIVLLHEFGHALACRQVGGSADQIILWPLGGVAFVNPPPRPGALLWSIAAGPLVNVVLVPITIAAFVAARFSPLAEAFDPADPLEGQPDVLHFLASIAIINFVLLVFNLLPIYPLDGGQIVRALLWFLVGPAKSLIAACTIGVIGGAMLAGLALFSGSPYGFIMAVFIGWQSLSGFMQGWRLHKIQPGVDCINRALAHLKAGNTGEALQECNQAIAMLGKYPPLLARSYQRRGTAHMMAGELDQAVADYSEANRLAPGSVEVLCNRAQAYGRLREYGHARADLEEVVRLNPKHALALNNLAWQLATCPRDEFRDGGNAVMLAKRACELSRWQVPTFIGTLGAAYAEVGRMAEAIAMQKKALESAKYQKTHGASSERRLQLYASGQPYRDEHPDQVTIF
jgi:tetratricopeptide (TPR) repeat protein